MSSSNFSGADIAGDENLGNDLWSRDSRTLTH